MRELPAADGQTSTRESRAVRTQIQGCLSASEAVILLDGFTANILLMRFLASGVTVSHSGEGYCKPYNDVIKVIHFMIRRNQLHITNGQRIDSVHALTDAHTTTLISDLH